MSIPYKINAVYANGRINSYAMVHQEDKSDTDRRKGMSTGEKNIVALIMFILKAKKDNVDLIFIDDPASAYDDYRKSQIYDLLKEYLSEKTVLLLSHDSVFAKLAVKDKYHKGEVLYIENQSSEVYLKEITLDDFFGVFEEFVKNRIKNCTDYYQRIINIRLLYEGNHGGSVYSYLSAIVHRKSKKTIEDELKKKNTTELHIFELMENKYPWLKGLLSAYSDGYHPTNVNSWALIEKAFIIREYFGDKAKEFGIKNELNDFIHINKALRVCLDPYRYNFCSRNLMEWLQQNDLDAMLTHLSS